MIKPGICKGKSSCNGCKTVLNRGDVAVLGRKKKNRYGNSGTLAICVVCARSLGALLDVYDPTEDLATLARKTKDAARRSQESVQKHPELRALGAYLRKQGCIVTVTKGIYNRRPVLVAMNVAGSKVVSCDAKTLTIKMAEIVTPNPPPTTRATNYLRSTWSSVTNEARMVKYHADQAAKAGKPVSAYVRRFTMKYEVVLADPKSIEKTVDFLNGV